MIHILKIGIMGAGLATLLGRVVGAALGYVMIKKTGVANKFSDFIGFKLDLDVQKTMIRLGVPAGFQSFFFIGARLVMNTFILPYGADHYSANVVFTQMLDLQCTGSTVVTAMAPAIMGMAKGKGDQDGIKQAFKDLMFFSFWLGAACSFIPLPFLKQINSLYNMSPLAATLANKMILWNPVYVIALAWFAQAAPAAFRGIGDAVLPPFITVFSVWAARVTTIGILTTFFNMGAYALYWGLAADYTLRCILYFWRYKSGAWLRAQRDV